MAQLVRDVMTGEPITLQATSTVQEAAKAMKRDNIGDVIVLDDGMLCGIVTDRDVVVRVVADGLDPENTRVGDICSRDLTCVAPEDGIDAAVELMRENAVRRLPVIENGRPVGIVSIGDLAQERDPSSALADISAAPANT